MERTRPREGDDRRLAAVVTGVAAIVALLIAVVTPTGYWWLTVQAEARESAVAARLHAAVVAQAIAGAGAGWERAVDALVQAPLTPAGLPEQRSIVSASGRIVAASGAAVPEPVLRSSVPLAQGPQVVGRFVVERSLRPVLWRTAGVGVLALALAALSYVSLRVLPLRALRRTLAALSSRDADSRARLEERLRVVFDNVADGIVVVGAQGTLEGANRAAARMLGYGAGLVGMHVSGLLRLAPERGSDDPFPVGRFEAVAITRDGAEMPVEVAVSELHGTGRRQRLGIVRDITARRQNEVRLARMASYDGLTGLPNRTLFRDRLQRAVTRARRTGRRFALMFLDLDRFRTVNDSLGHDVGDDLLVAVARVLAQCVRDTDSVARGAPGDLAADVFRLGGDEFTVLVEDLDDPQPAAAVARRILAALGRPFTVGSHELCISASIGITVFEHDGTDLDGLVRQADLAMQRAKELGRDGFAFFDPAMQQEASRRQALEERLRRALARGEFRLHYQPGAQLATGRVTGVELLLRWQPDGEPMVPAEEFQPLLEQTGLIVPVGAWALRAACEQLVSWRRAGLPALGLAVDLSARQLRQQDLAAAIAGVLRETGLEPGLLEVQLAETLLEERDAVRPVLRALGATGVRIAVDRFGSGRASLAGLRRVEADTLKLDRALVRDVPRSADDSAVAAAVIALGRALRLKVVATGVERPEQADFLRAQGCDELQGPLVGGPLDAAAFVAWLRARRPAGAGFPPPR